MRYGATATGIVGAVLGLVSGTIFGCFTSAMTLVPGVGSSPATALVLLALATPIVALAGSIQAVRKPRLAGSLLAAAGVVAAAILRSDWQALFYSAAAVLALLAERQVRAAEVPGPQAPRPSAAAPPSPPSAAAPPSPPPAASPALPRAQPFIFSPLAGVSGIAAALAGGIWALQHAGSVVSIAGGVFLMGVVSAILSAAALAGVFASRTQPWGGGFLTIVAAGLAVVISGAVAVIVPAFGLWAVASNVYLVVTGVGELRSRRMPTQAPGTRQGPVPGSGQGLAPAQAVPSRGSRLASGLLLAAAALTVLYSGWSVLGATHVMGRVFPDLFAPRMMEEEFTPLSAEGCLAVGPFSDVDDYGWLDDTRLWVDGYGKYGVCKATFLGLDGTGRLLTVKGKFPKPRTFVLRDGSGYLTLCTSITWTGAEGNSELYLCIAGEPRRLLLSGRFDAVPSPSGRYLLCAYAGRAVVCDLSSSSAAAEPRLLEAVGAAATGAGGSAGGGRCPPYWCGEDLLVVTARADGRESYVLVDLSTDREVETLSFPGRSAVLCPSPDGRWLAALVLPHPQAPIEPTVARRGSEIALYDLEALSEPGQSPGMPITIIFSTQAARNEAVGYVTWSDDGSKLAFSDAGGRAEGPDSGTGNSTAPGSGTGQPKAAVFVALAPAFDPIPAPLDPAVPWRPGGFSPGGRYLLVYRLDPFGSVTGAAIVDTETGAPPEGPPPGLSDPSVSSLTVIPVSHELAWHPEPLWLGPTTLWTYRSAAGKGATEKTPAYYDILTGHVTPFAWEANVLYWEGFELSPDRRYGCLVASVYSDSGYVPAQVTGLGPFNVLPTGYWLFVFPIDVEG